MCGVYKMFHCLELAFGFQKSEIIGEGLFDNVCYTHFFFLESNNSWLNAFKLCSLWQEKNIIINLKGK